MPSASQPPAPMRVGVSVPADLRTIAEAARRAEALGYDALSVGETRHHPFLPLALAAEHSSRLTLSTAVAIAFPRAPHVTANLAWDLARYSGGRFALGLGTQVKGHNERRFSVPWAPPGPRIADYVGCLRAIWDSWQHGTRPAYEGEFYQYRLTAPAFNPGPIEHPRIPILISAVTPFTARLAGRIAGGAIVPAAVSFRYVREVLLPALLAGAREAGGAVESGATPAAPELRGAGYLATGPDERAVSAERERARAEVARALATRAAAGVVELHGWQERAERLRRLAGDARWDELPAEVDDAMLDELCVAGTWEELPALARERCAGAATQLELPLPDRERDAGERERFAALIVALRDVPVAQAC